MSTRSIGVAAVAVSLLLPGAALLGVATLIPAPAAGTAGCVSGDSAGADRALAVSASVPTRLTARTAGGETVTLNHRQLQRAAAIIAVGTAEDVPARGQLSAVTAALTESSLRDLSNTSAYPASARFPNDGNGGDHDSLGLFQMRPSTGWGTVADLMDQVWSARAFYGGPAGPNHGSPRGLLDLPGWRSMQPGAAAQAVEGSAYPGRYALNAPVAAKVLATLTGTAADLNRCGPRPDVRGLPTGLQPGFPRAFIAAAATQIGTPYVWGGGSFTGPTGGGFDCSGLVLYAAYVASDGHLRLPHYTGDQLHYGRPVAWADRQPGDLVFFSYPGASGPHHVAIYLGGDRILQAPRTGEDVRYGTLSEFAGQVMTIRRLE